MMQSTMQNFRKATCSLAILAACFVASFGARCDETSSQRSLTTSTSKESKSDDANSKQVPQSAFVVPSSTKEGRDPFFPNLTPYMPVAPVSKGPQTPKASGVDDLVLQGVSGQVDRKLCVINGRTLGVGNEEDVPVQGGLLRVRCLEINETFVVIELGGERRELHFKGQK